MRRDDPRHGTYRGYLAHAKERKRPCKPCRLARNAYMRAYRSRPEVHVRVSRETNARSRALWRLASEHPEEYRRLYLIELGQPEMEEPA